MPKVLLINPPFNITKDNYDSSISVGLLSIATYLDSKNIPVEIVDGVRQKEYLNFIKDKIKDCQYAGLSVMTTQIPAALEVSRLIKDINPDCQIVWGGPHPTFFPEQTASHSSVDIVCVGEGEIVMQEIVSGKDLAGIKGIVYKKNNTTPPNPPSTEGGRQEESISKVSKVNFNPPQELHDPAQMPLFNWDLEPKEVLEGLYLVPSLTSRGCPHRCIFCINAILKNKWRPRTAEQVLEDIRIIKSKEYFSAQGGGKKLRFWDENFFVDMDRARKIIDGMLEKDLVIPWETTVRCNYLKEGMIDDEFMVKLKESGCYLLSFGAESGCPRILSKIKKDILPEDVLRSAEMSLKHDIIPQYSFMIGLPGETKKDMMATLELIDKLVKLSDKIQILGPQAFRPYPGSPLYEECKEAGWQEPNSLEEWFKLVEDELNYLSVKNFPWVKDKDFVESMEAYVRFGAHSIKSAMGSSIKAPKLLKLGFVLLCKLRWKLKFFKWPIEYKIAKKFVSN